jgi:hypothetical protein
MKWRDEVKLAVAKKLYTEVAVRDPQREPNWDADYVDRNYWLEAAAGAIKAVREGASEAGWTVEFKKYE